MSFLIVAPIALPLLAAPICLAFRRYLFAQRVVSAGALMGLLAASIMLLTSAIHDGPRALEVGGWEAPFGIVLLADAMSGTMTVITGVIGLATVIYSFVEADKQPPRVFHPLLLLMLAGVSGAFLTGDLFNLYVWFEVILIGSVGLLVLGGGPRRLDAALKYLVLNFIPTTMLLLAIALVYGVTGTLNMADLALKMPELQDRTIPRVAFWLLLVAFGSKAALFPLFFWLPASYPTPAVAVSAVLAGLLTKVGVYAMYRVFPLILPGELQELQPVLLWVSGLTMLTGVLGAVAQNEIRRILSFHIISQIGYMLMGLALLSSLSVLGGVFYIAHHIIVKTNLFFVGGIAGRLSGSSRLERMGGLLATRPLLALLFVLPAASLAGVPPLSGFWAKLLLIKSGLDIGAQLLVAVALAVGLLTLYSMSKIWLAAFWGEPQRSPPASGGEWPLYVPALALAGLTVTIGLFPEFLANIAESASNQLLDRSLYVRTVLAP